MIELTQEDYRFNLPLGDRFSFTVVAHVYIVDGRLDDVEGYELHDVWNLSKDRGANADELEFLKDYKEEIGNRIDWETIYQDTYYGSDDGYYYREDDCND